ncbi:MAG: response regulator [Pseudorhodobacter sp.]
MSARPDQSDEIVRQLDLIWRERWLRIGLTNFAYALCVIFIPVWIALACAVVNLAAEILSMRLMRGLDPRGHVWRHRIVLMLNFLMEFAFALAPVLVWHSQEAYAKPFAVGMVMTTLLQVATVRALHLPIGLAGFAGVAAAVLPGNAIYWIARDDLSGLVLSTLCAAGGLTYALVALLSNHRLNAESIDARRKALAGERAKGQFLAQMSHELRTPLNAILGMGHAEMRRSRDMLSQQRLSVLMASAEGLSTILDDILDLSAIQEGRMPIRRQPIRPKREIEATLALFQPDIEAAGLHLTTRIDGNLAGRAMVDPHRLRQCLSNLLSNAIKHTAIGEIRVTAGRIVAPDGTELLEVEVADSGGGIPQHLHEVVFEPFCNAPDLPRPVPKARSEQAPHSESLGARTHPPLPAAQSNGLGLSISRALARQMGGDLVIRSAAADTGKSEAKADNAIRGAAFRLTVTLPQLPTAAMDADDAATPGPGAAAPPAAALPANRPEKGLRVLVVDDIATNRLVASTYLRMLGASMIEASSGEEALALLTDMPPDLVLLDMNMPRMDGRETVRRIRAMHGPVGTVAVIAMTADALSEHRETYLASGVDGYLSKPLNPERMAAEIAAVLARCAERNQPERP